MKEKTLSGPVVLVTRFPVHRCRECGDPIAQGKRVWWMRGVGSAHITCGWTLESGSIHPSTRSSIRDVVGEAQLDLNANAYPLSAGQACPAKGGTAGATCGGAKQQENLFGDSMQRGKAMP